MGNDLLPPANFLTELHITLTWGKAAHRPRLVNDLLGKKSMTIGQESERWRLAAAEAWKTAAEGRTFGQPVYLVVQPYWTGRQPDADSLSLTAKFILDGAVRPTSKGHSKGKHSHKLAGVLHDDSPRYFLGTLVLAAHLSDFEQIDASLVTGDHIPRLIRQSELRRERGLAAG